MRHKLAFKYFMAATLLFGSGYGVAWATSIAPKTGEKKKEQPQALASVTPNIQNEEKNNDTKPSTKPGTQYTVQSGDTLSNIASANGTTFEVLAQYNDIPYPYNLTDGQIITIPAK